MRGSRLKDSSCIRRLVWVQHRGLFQTTKALNLAWSSVFLIFSFFLILPGGVGFPFCGTYHISAFHHDLISFWYLFHFIICICFHVYLVYWFLPRGNFVSQGTFGNVWKYFWLAQLGWGCYWHPERRGYGYYQILHCTGRLSTIKNYPSPNVNNDEFEKPCSSPWDLRAGGL